MCPSFLKACGRIAPACLSILMFAGASTAPFAATTASLEITDAWIRATPPGADVAAGYFTVRNTGTSDLRIVDLKSPLAAAVRIDALRNEGGRLRMVAMDAGLPVKAGETLVLMPGAIHLMLTGITATFTDGMSVPLTLSLDDGSELALSVPVQSTHAGGHKHQH